LSSWDLAAEPGDVNVVRGGRVKSLSDIVNVDVVQNAAATCFAA
jgi:hypothetical protein